MESKAGDLQEQAGMWVDFDPMLRATARVYLGSLGVMGVNAIVDRATPADWFGLRMILGTRLADKLRDNTEKRA